MLRSLGWMTATAMGLSIGFVVEAGTKSATGESSSPPEAVVAQMSDTCTPIDESLGIVPQRYTIDGAPGGERTWQWEQGDFRLSEYRAQETCGDEAGDFPVVFEAE